MKKIAVIPAGGLGVRFWPRSTEKTPKQFIHIHGEGTMIQNTVSRLQKDFAMEDIYIVTSDNMRALITDQMPALPKENIIIEPFGRNTAPCLGLAYIHLKLQYEPDTLMYVFPADHVIYNIGEFSHSLEVAGEAAYNLKGLVTIGINPTRPDTQFGYVQIDQNKGKLGDLFEKGVRVTNTFAEKPDLGTARRFLESGDFLWNSGMFVWRFDTFWKAFSGFMPEESAHLQNLQKHIGKASYKNNLEFTFRQFNSISIDYAMMEKASNVFTVESSFTWSDMGTWDEVFRLSMKDSRNNVINGDVVPINTSNSFITSDERMIGIVDVEDLIVIDTKEALLICKRGSSENVKELVDFLRRRNVNHIL